VDEAQVDQRRSNPLNEVTEMNQSLARFGRAVIVSPNDHVLHAEA